MVLAIFKATGFWNLNGFHGLRLVFVLIRDQAIYFLLYAVSFNLIGYADILSRAIFVAVFAVTADEMSIDTNTVIANIILSLGKSAFLGILGSRIFFNLKEAAEHGVNVGTNWSSYSHSTIRFDGPQNEEETGV